MPNTCFYFLVNMSISGAVVIAVLLIIRQIRIIPRRWLYPLWLAVLFRLAVPVALSSSISIFNGITKLLENRVPVATVVVVDTAVSSQPDQYGKGMAADMRLTFTNSGTWARERTYTVDPLNDGMYQSFAMLTEYYPIQYKTLRLTRIFTIGTYIWIAGAGLLIFAVLVLYYILHRQYRDSTLVRDHIFTSVHTPSPFVMGITKPKIMLPDDFDMNQPQVSHIIAHEAVHMRRKDNLWRLIGLVITCLHWFNPLVWLGYSCFLKDMEFSCDEIATKGYSGRERKEYAEALLAIAGRPQQQNPLPSAFGRTSTGARILNVLSGRNISLFGTVIAIIFLLVITIMLVTNAQV